MPTVRKHRSFFVAAFCLLVSGMPMMFIGPQALPAKRIIENLTALLEKSPKDHHMVYTLARVYYLSLINQSELIPGFGSGADGRPAPAHIARGFLVQQRYERAGAQARKDMGVERSTPLRAEQRKRFNKLQRENFDALEKSGWVPKPLDAKTREEYARSAMRLFDSAINLEPGQGLYHLGRASLGEQVLQLVKAKKLKKVLPGLTVDSVAEMYFKAFELALNPELKINSIPIEGLEGLVSHEAGEAFLRLVNGKKADVSPKDKARVKKVGEGLAKLRKMRRGPITPILIGNTAGSTLTELLDPACSVFFDLDGDGVREHWPWVQPDTGILCWAPMGVGPVESGRQLFGSVTFHLLHRDGYEALRLLDDDLDGELKGMELDGLAIWRDENADGRSSAAELTTLWDAGVEAIATWPNDREGRAPKNTLGLRFADGRVVPTIDWMVERR